MMKAAEYRQHAAECRDLATLMDSDPQREQLLRMAAKWEQLAQERDGEAAREARPPGEDDLP